MGVVKESGLSQKQEAFAQAVASGMNHADAYRKCYNVGPTTTSSTIRSKSSALARSKKIQTRISELRAPVVEEVGITLRSHLDMLAKIRDAAMADTKWSPAVTAEIARGKAAGIQVERSIITNLNKTLPASVDDFV